VTDDPHKGLWTIIPGMRSALVQDADGVWQVQPRTDDVRLAEQLLEPAPCTRERLAVLRALVKRNELISGRLGRERYIAMRSVYSAEYRLRGELEEAQTELACAEQVPWFGRVSPREMELRRMGSTS
jgi:hypothetical protein